LIGLREPLPARLCMESLGKPRSGTTAPTLSLIMTRPFAASTNDFFELEF
jgi:hypothetical protein